MKKLKIHLLFGSLLLFIGMPLIQGGDVWAIDYPTKPIQLVGVFPAGGVTDIICRILAATLPDFIGQPVVVLNKPGGSGVVGTSWAAKQKPDGYTIFMGQPSPLITLSLFTDLPYSRKDFIPLATLCTFPTVVGVLPKSPFKTWKDIVAYARENPEKLTYCISGPFAFGNLLMHGIMAEEKIRLKPIPETGCPPCLMAVLGGHRDIYVCEVWHEGLRFIANFSPVRSPRFYPDVPTFKEMGYNVYGSAWWSPAALKGTPPEIVSKLKEAIKKAFESKQFQEMIKAVNAELYFLSAEETEKMWERDYIEIRNLLEKSGLEYKYKKK